MSVCCEERAEKAKEEEKRREARGVLRRPRIHFRVAEWRFSWEEKARVEEAEILSESSSNAFFFLPWPGNGAVSPTPPLTHPLTHSLSHSLTLSLSLSLSQSVSL